MRDSARPLSAARSLALTVPRGVPLEQRDDAPHQLRVHPKRVRRLRRAAEAERRVAAGIVLFVELLGVAIGDAFGQPAAVLLGAVGLADQLIPVVAVGTEKPAVAHDEGDAGRVEAILEQLERPAQVALPAVRVAG